MTLLNELPLSFQDIMEGRFQKGYFLEGKGNLKLMVYFLPFLCNYHNCDTFLELFINRNECVSCV